MPATYRAGVLLAAIFIGLNGFRSDSLQAGNRDTQPSDAASDATHQRPLCSPLVVEAKPPRIDGSEQSLRQVLPPATTSPVVSAPALELGQFAPNDGLDLSSMRDSISRKLQRPVRIVAIEVAASADDFLADGDGNGSGLANEERDWSGVSAEPRDASWDEMPIIDGGDVPFIKDGVMPYIDGGALPCPSYHSGCQCQDCCGITYPHLGILGYLLTPSDPCMADFISPMTNPVFFEDPRSLTEVRGIFLNNTVPSRAGGGQVRSFALQARAALSERCSVIATKSGFISSSNPAIADGWADLTAGLKYNMVSNPCTGNLFALGATYEFSVGSPQTLQDTGEGRVNVFASGGTRIGSRLHWLSAAGYRIPMNSSIDSQSWYWSNHLDLRISECIYLLAECNWYHWTKSGSGGIDGLEGLDLFNFGSTGVTGKDIATGAFGIKLKPHRHVEVGAAWEMPVTDERDIMENRLTMDCILRY